MRIFKLIGVLVVVLAFSAVAVATASAEETLWRWLPGSAKESFKGKSGKATLQVWEGIKGEKPGASITCAKSEALLSESQLLEKEAKLGLTQIHFTTCAIGGLPVNSVSDASGVILTHVELHNCLIKKEAVGIIFEPLEVTLEVPSTKLTVIVKGSFVGLVKKVGASVFELIINQKEGHQGIELCEGGAKRTLLANIDSTKFVEAGEEAKEGKLEFDKTLDAEEVNML